MRPSRLSLPVLAACALSLFPHSTSGDPSVVWLMPGGGVVWPPAELGVEDASPLAGGIVGVRIFKGLAVEGRGHYTKADHDSIASDLTITHGEGNLTWFLWNEARFTPYVTGGAGATRLKFEGGGEATTKFTWNAGGGVKLMLGDRAALRAEVRDLRYELEGRDGTQSRHSPEGFAGFSIGFGGRAADADLDRVPDRSDRCPDTPPGARVDASGCPIDGDSDGVYDGIDQCAGTPPGAAVDASGCPRDADRDGVSDGIDKCAGTPVGARVDATGCPSDADGDGTFDGIDQCDDTPKGCVVDATGCTIDPDADGVCEGIDDCPGTPAGARVDAKGCEISAKETELLDTGMIRLKNVKFDVGQAKIKAESFPVLDEVGKILAGWPELLIEIGGHTDSQGSDAANQKLSEARANAVLAYLVSKFPELNPDQLTARGYGESEPVAPNSTAAGKAENRRVEFKVLNTDMLRREKQ